MLRKRPGETSRKIISVPAHVGRPQRRPQRRSADLSTTTTNTAANSAACSTLAGRACRAPSRSPPALEPALLQRESPPYYLRPLNRTVTVPLPIGRCRTSTGSRDRSLPGD
jgi:hypothetical protein